MLWLILLGFAMSSCDDDVTGPGESPDHDPAEQVWLSFRILGQDAAARAVVSDDGAEHASRASDAAAHPDELASEFENYIDPEDLNILLLNSSQQVVKTIGSSEISLSRQAKDNVYEVKTQIDRQYFDIIGYDTPFYILVVANSQGTGDGDTMTQYHFDKLTDISREFRNYRYHPSTVWQPDGAENRIPMSGIRRFSGISAAQIDAALDSASPFEIVEPVEMLRCMSKFRILDAINTQTSLPDPVRISNVEIIGGFDRGTLIPDLSVSNIWVEGDYVVDYASGPVDWRVTSHSLQTFMTVDSSVDGFTSYRFTDTDGQVYDYQAKFECYAPEQRVSNRQNEKADLPKVRITTQTFRDKKWGDEQTYVYDLATLIAGHPLGSVDRNLVRNHIYQFVVTKADKSTLNITYQVCPWVSASTNIEFN